MIRLNCYAKINFVLDVLGKRADGYHELVMVMQSVSLADTLTIETTPSPGIMLTTNKAITPEPQKNLVYKATEIFLQQYPQKNGVKIHIEKHIPLAAGLAGGSTDCAGALQGLSILFKLNLSLNKLEHIANRLGSDIAFCLQGGTMLARGRGELLSALPSAPTLYGIIVKPPFPIATADVYRSIPKDYIGKESSEMIRTYHHGKITIDNLQENLTNDLYNFALSLKPELKDYIMKIKMTNPIGCQMSGSGPAIFAFYSNKKSRDKAEKQLSEYEIFPVETQKTGWEIIA